MDQKIRTRIERALPIGFQIEDGAYCNTLVLSCSNPGGFATLDLEARAWALGVNATCSENAIRLGAAQGGYRGRGWVEKLARDAVEALRRAAQPVGQ